MVAGEDFRTLVLNVFLMLDELCSVDAGVVVTESGSEW
jgi:hypothetical protein